MNKKSIIITIISVLVLTCIFAFARTTTTDLGLVKPTWTEDLDILTDLNANSDILEAFANDPLEHDSDLERLEDRAGAMWTGNTETFITITYQDADNTVDAVVPVKDEDNMASDSATFLCTQQSIKAYADTLHALQYLKTEIDTKGKVEAIWLLTIPDLTGTPVQYDYGRFTDADTFEGRSYSEMKADLDLEIGTDVQAFDNALTSISGLAYVSPSFVKLTANDTYAVRTLAEVKSDLSLNLVENTALSAWAGTSSITTLGTIGTGAWNGDVILPAYGGTGVANGANNTITFTGNYTLGLTLTANTSLTAPTSGTLATLAGTEAFTNKTLTSPKLNEDVVVTTTATKLNYLTGATGTTGTATTNLVYSTSPTFTTQITTPKVVGNATGLYLYDDGGNGIFVKDGGYVGMGGETSPDSPLHITNSATYTIELESSGGPGILFNDTVETDRWWINTAASPAVLAFTISQDGGGFANVVEFLPTANVRFYGSLGIGTSNPSGDLDINVAIDADPHFLLSENNATKWDIYNDHNDDALQIKAGATLRYEFHIDGTANADVAWGTFSPVVEGEGKELLAIALEDANKPVKPYEGIPVVKTDDELFDMIPTEYEEEVPVLDDEGVQLTNPFGEPLFETVVKIKDEKVYRPRKDNEFTTEAEKQVEYDKYHKVPAKIAIANAKYLEYLTEIIDELTEKIKKLENPMEPIK